ncbi:MAG: carboxypeptidase-like regulatory domain-containing protein [Sphingobacteriales bacterium]
MQLKKQYFAILFLLASIGGKAQVITGRVLGDTTNKPVTATIVTHSGHQTSSNNNGEFSIPVSGIGDTIKVFAIGYKIYFFPVKDLTKNNIIVRLKPVSMMLRDVVIRAERNHKKDSINLRKDYAQVFNFQPTKVTDAFTGNPLNVPFAFVSIDLLTLFKALTKNSDPEYKFKKLLLKDEQADYVATRFNRGLIIRETGLKGDSLNTFIDKYYPTVAWVHKTSDYDMIQYIRAKAVEFRKKP